MDSDLSKEDVIVCVASLFLLVGFGVALLLGLNPFSWLSN